MLLRGDFLYILLLAVENMDHDCDRDNGGLMMNI